MDADRQVFLGGSIDSMKRMRSVLARPRSLSDIPGALVDLHHAIHSARGACGFLGIPRVADLAQAGVELVTAMREGSVLVSASGQQLLLELVDTIILELTSLRDGSDEETSDYRQLLDELRRKTDGPTPVATATGVRGDRQSGQDKDLKSALVVDDSKAMRRLLGRVLSGMGFTVNEAESGEEGLEMLQASEQAPDVVLIDWTLPKMDGVEFVRSFRAMPGMGGVRVMMVTSETMPHQVEKALAAGVNRYVTKPFTKDRIIEVVREMGVA